MRKIYDWIVANTYREPKVRGCGVGDIKTMLETGNFGGKCGDINGLFVGLCRAVGIPARDIYGIRLVPSPSATSELGGNPANLQSAQHCRAEVYLKRHGWVAMDPADVGKVMRPETPEWIKDIAHPWSRRSTRRCSAAGKATGSRSTPPTTSRCPGARRQARLPHVPAGRERERAATTRWSRTTSSTRSPRARSLPEG